MIGDDDAKRPWVVYGLSMCGMWFWNPSARNDLRALRMRISCAYEPFGRNQDKIHEWMGA